MTARSARYHAPFESHGIFTLPWIAYGRSACRVHRRRGVKVIEGRPARNARTYEERHGAEDAAVPVSGKLGEAAFQVHHRHRDGRQERQVRQQERRCASEPTRQKHIRKIEDFSFSNIVYFFVLAACNKRGMKMADAGRNNSEKSKHSIMCRDRIRRFAKRQSFNRL